MITSVGDAYWHPFLCSNTLRKNGCQCANSYVDNIFMVTLSLKHAILVKHW